MPRRDTSYVNDTPQSGLGMRLKDETKTPVLTPMQKYGSCGVTSAKRARRKPRRPETQRNKRKTKHRNITISIHPLQADEHGRGNKEDLSSFHIPTSFKLRGFLEQLRDISGEGRAKRAKYARYISRPAIHSSSLYSGVLFTASWQHSNQQPYPYPQHIPVGQGPPSRAY